MKKRFLTYPFKEFKLADQPKQTRGFLVNHKHVLHVKIEISLFYRRNTKVILETTPPLLSA